MVNVPSATFVDAAALSTYDGDGTTSSVSATNWDGACSPSEESGSSSVMTGVTSVADFSRVGVMPAFAASLSRRRFSARAFFCCDLDGLEDSVPLNKGRVHRPFSAKERRRDLEHTFRVAVAGC